MFGFSLTYSSTALSPSSQIWEAHPLWLIIDFSLLAVIPFSWTMRAVGLSSEVIWSAHIGWGSRRGWSLTHESSWSTNQLGSNGSKSS